jgi:hypothetical protein
MAKRYLTHQDLLEIVGENVDVNYKIPGTMGNHFMSIEDMGNFLLVKGKTLERGDRGYCPDKAKYVVNYTLKPDRQVTLGSVRIYPGDTLGYNCGEVWVLKDPNMIKDPVKRVCRLAKAKLVVVDDFPQFFYPERCSYYWTVTREGVEILHDGVDIENEWLGQRAQSSLNPEDFQIQESRLQVEGQTFVIERRYAAGGGRSYTKGSTVYVKRGLTPNIELLAKELGV